MVASSPHRFCSLVKVGPVLGLKGRKLARGNSPLQQRAAELKDRVRRRGDYSPSDVNLARSP